MTDGVVFDAILHREPAPPSAVRPSLGHELDALVMRLLDKDPEFRFQTAADLRSSCRHLTRGSISTPTPREEERARVVRDAAKRTTRKMHWPTLAAIAGAMGLVAAGFLWLIRLPPVPRVVRITQITHDGTPKDYFVNDGARLYYAAGYRSPKMRLFQVSAKGGDPIPMAAQTGLFPFDISPDGSELLLARDPDGSLWVLPVLEDRCGEWAI